MSIHAHGIPERQAPHGQGVMIDFPAKQMARLHNLTRQGSIYRLRMTIEEAQQLQYQLGVAIGEAAGQQKLDLTDRPHWNQGMD